MANKKRKSRYEKFDSPFARTSGSFETKRRLDYYSMTRPSFLQLWSNFIPEFRTLYKRFTRLLGLRSPRRNDVESIRCQIIRKQDQSSSTLWCACYVEISVYRVPSLRMVRCNRNIEKRVNGHDVE